MPRSFLHFSAKLLFQFRVVTGRKSGLRRLCEERIVTFEAQSAEQAWKKANRLGHKEQHAYESAADRVVHFEYLGIMELLHLGLERSGPEEVWYDIVERLKPSERRSAFIPRKQDLQAFAQLGLRKRAPRLRRRRK